MNKEIWDDQEDFNKQFFNDQNLDLKNLTIFDKIKWAKEFFFHINSELISLMECFPNWKMHYKNNEREEEYVSSNLKEEYIDVFKYVLGLGQVIGITYDDIITCYKEKTEVVKQKYAQNKQIEYLKNKKVIIFDIDGVINNYPDCFVDWVNSEKNKQYDSIASIKSKLEKKAYDEIKTAYRLSGAKKFQATNKNTIDAMKLLHESNESIVLFTNRPVSSYKVIYSDTLYWLKNNNIPFDAIYWSDYQQKKDIYKLNLDIKFIVEDNINNAKEFNRQGHLVFLIDTNLNQSDYINKLLVRIKKVSDIIDVHKNRY